MEDSWQDLSGDVASLRSAKSQAVAEGAKVRYEYTSALKGFAGSLTPKALDVLRSNPDVAYIEADQRVHATETQSPATWGLDRIDQRNRPLSNSYTYNQTGAGVNAYVIDTGLLGSHTEFTGRVGTGYTAINDGRGTTDCAGHGTHVAGTVGGTTHDVAKCARIFPVRVLGCDGSGSNAGVIAGVDWVTSNHVKPAVANMSLGGSDSSALDSAVVRAINAGVTMAVAAGNDNANACSGSPNKVPAALTVGSSTSTDARSDFSNYGSCVDIFAPGSNITSAWYTGSTATKAISGTSMASPHVAGAVALYLQTNPSASPATVANALVSTATTGVLTGIGTGSPNRLLYSLFDGGTTPTPTPTPTSTSTPTPTPGCALTEKYSGSLSGTDDYDDHPNGTYFYTSRSGTHRGCLTGPAGADFDIRLYKWNGVSWSIVARGEGETSTENVSYTGTAGYYFWRVRSYSGSGSYSFQMQRP